MAGAPSPSTALCPEIVKLVMFICTFFFPWKYCKCEIMHIKAGSVSTFDTFHGGAEPVGSKGAEGPDFA